MTGKDSDRSYSASPDSQYQEGSEGSPQPVDGAAAQNIQIRRRLLDVGGVLLVALSVMTLLAFLIPSISGGVLGWWTGILQIWFGWGIIWVTLTLALAGIWILREHSERIQNMRWGRVIALEVAAFSSLAFLAVLGGGSIAKAEAGWGGRIGWGISELFYIVFEPLGFAGTFLILLILSIVLMTGLLLGLGLFSPLVALARSFTEDTSYPGTDGLAADPAVVEAPLQGGQILTGDGDITKSRSRKKRQAVSPEFRKKFRVQPDADSERTTVQTRDERLPPLDLLVKEKSSKPDERSINQTAGLIEQTLSEFGIPANVVGFQVGPTVTQFAVEPGFVQKDKSGEEEDVERHKVRVAQIAALRRDLALALSAERLRIQAPVPGRPYIGIEVPNTRSIVVRLRPILESDAFYKINAPLTIGLGRNVSGQAVVADLGMMPHLLVAGATGSGKSVCIAAIMTCLVMNNTPQDLRLVVVDPKMVELVRFNGLPHLLGKVETDLERILAVLRWTVAEMDRRYMLLESSRSRNIDTYNRKARRRKDIEPIPRLVLLVDELADLMMTAPDQTEHNLVRLAQMARATGIHLIVATQRPSTDVVTGIIKANFPARISFSVASSVDSRVILDTVGAEHLLGRGDMLFLPPEASGPIRTQGVMVSDQEVERVITFWQKSIASTEDGEQPPWDVMIEEEQALAAKDVLLTRAVEIVRDTQRASASMLQRKLRIGYPRAARLMDEMESMGIIGPSQSGGRDREVLIGKDDEIYDRSGQ
jgi:S-DNA-T family DNA segregation ATPase FtsK/SpoIIIE